MLKSIFFLTENLKESILSCFKINDNNKNNDSNENNENSNINVENDFEFVVKLCEPLLQFDLHSVLLKDYLQRVAPQLFHANDFRNSYSQQSILFRLCLIYIDPKLYLHLSEKLKLNLETIARHWFESLFHSVLQSENDECRVALLDRMLVNEEVALPLFVALALFVVKRDSFWSFNNSTNDNSDKASTDISSLNALLACGDLTAFRRVLRVAASLETQLPSSIRQQWESSTHSRVERRFERWRYYTSESVCLCVSLAEVVRSSAPPFIGVDIRDETAQNSSNVVACAQVILI